LSRVVGTTERAQLQKIDGLDPIFAYLAAEGARALYGPALRE
jgi:hypothetical protein